MVPWKSAELLGRVRPSSLGPHCALWARPPFGADGACRTGARSFDSKRAGSAGTAGNKSGTLWCGPLDSAAYVKYAQMAYPSRIRINVKFDRETVDGTL